MEHGSFWASSRCSKVLSWDAVASLSCYQHMWVLGAIWRSLIAAMMAPPGHQSIWRGSHTDLKLRLCLHHAHVRLEVLQEIYCVCLVTVTVKKKIISPNWTNHSSDFQLESYRRTHACISCIWLLKDQGKLWVLQAVVKMQNVFVMFSIKSPWTVWGRKWKKIVEQGRISTSSHL